VKKKAAKKLSLSRETISRLSGSELQDALGAYGTIETQCCNTRNECSMISCGPIGCTIEIQ
jgi:hypothetical protein